MKKKYKRLIGILLIILILIIIGLLGIKFVKSLDKKEIKIIETIDNFDYALEDRDTVLYKNIHRELKNNLENETIDYLEYAKEIAQLFIIDLFTLNNKLSTYDVGGVEFVYPDALENYKLNVEDTLYKNIVWDKKSSLPIVSSIKVTDTKEDTFTINEENLDSYVISLEWEYEKDYGYDKKGIVTLVKKDDKIYIVEYKTKE